MSDKSDFHLAEFEALRKEIDAAVSETRLRVEAVEKVDMLLGRASSDIVQPLPSDRSSIARHL